MHIELIPEDADKEISSCLDINNPRSFFLFAGAGSGKTRSLVTALQEFKKKIFRIHAAEWTKGCNHYLYKCCM